MESVKLGPLWVVVSLGGHDSEAGFKFRERTPWRGQHLLHPALNREPAWDSSSEEGPGQEHGQLCHHDQLCLDISDVPRQR